MPKTIEGKVISVGQIKEYETTNSALGMGKYSRQYYKKFFLLIVDDEGEEHKAMVVVGYIAYNDWREPMNKVDYERGRPSVGDRVCYTTHSERNGWGSVTAKQSWNILERGSSYLMDELERQVENTNVGVALE